MQDVQQFDIPEIAEEYGDEDYVEITEIYYDPEFARVVVLVEDLDAIDGHNQFTFDAKKRDDTVIITSRAVGVPHPEDARQLKHLTSVEVLDEIKGIEFDIEE